MSSVATCAIEDKHDYEASVFGSSLWRRLNECGWVVLGTNWFRYSLFINIASFINSKFSLNEQTLGRSLEHAEQDELFMPWTQPVHRWIIPWIHSGYTLYTMRKPFEHTLNKQYTLNNSLNTPWTNLINPEQSLEQHPQRPHKPLPEQSLQIPHKPLPKQPLQRPP